MQYLIGFIGGGVIAGSLVLNKIFGKKQNLILKIISILLILVFACRMFCAPSIIDNDPSKYWGLDSSPLHNEVLTAFVLLFIWGSYTAVLFVMMRPFFDIKFANNIVKYILPIVYIIQIIFISDMCVILEEENSPIFLKLFLSIESAFGLGISLYYLIASIIDKELPNIKDIGFMFLGIVLLSIFTMPTYFPQYMFDIIPSTITMGNKEFKLGHRLLLYFGFIIPLVIYFSLAGRNRIHIKYCLTYMTLGVMIGFCVGYYYKTFTEPWSWPFHLCNTALFILPLVLIFNMKRLFYFTYFINVLGALLAMLMPNYGTELNILSMRVIGFWYNHYFAFFMPLLFVALDMFERPKLRQFIYSMLWFLFYFTLALTLNVVFTEIGHETDFFFLNSNFITDKFGDWANQLFDIKLVLHVKDHAFVFRPVYQGIFFGVYIVLGLIMWFVYAEAYRIVDSNAFLFMRLKKMRREEKELKIALAGRKLEEPMEKDAGIKYQLINFSKKYGTSKTYAVKDANFEVHGGEIFGFLGPNGAGKSTIIKSTVGIQPITSGNINICGYDVATQPVQCKALMGFVPDHYALYEKLSGREYVNYIADIYGVSKEDRDARIEPLVKRFELETSFDNMIKTYSHGMKQKITIMAALVHDPKVWILDEPLTGLDPNSIYQVKECMKEHAARGNIVFFSSHIIDIVEKLCERIAIIKHGEIQCIKTVKEIEESGYSLEQFYLKTIDNEIEGISKPHDEEELNKEKVEEIKETPKQEEVKEAKPKKRTRKTRKEK